MDPCTNIRMSRLHGSPPPLPKCPGGALQGHQHERYIEIYNKKSAQGDGFFCRGVRDLTGDLNIRCLEALLSTVV
jgi:hypothetical protein